MQTFKLDFYLKDAVGSNVSEWNGLAYVMVIVFVPLWMNGWCG